MKRKEVVLIAITVVLLIVMIVGFVRDRNEAVLKRTLPFEYTDDMEVVEMEKKGMLLARTSYEAKIRVECDDIYELFEMIWDAAGVAVENPEDNYIEADEYERFKATVLRDSDIVPEPDPDTRVWAFGFEDGGHDYYCVVDIEGSSIGAEGNVEGGEIYLYVYYTR